MPRNALLLTLMLATPLAAQVPTAPPTPKTPAVRPTNPAPLSPRIDLFEDMNLNLSLDRAFAYADMARTYENFDFSYPSDLARYESFAPLTTIAYADAFGSSFNGGPRSPWAKNDPADSLYRSARDMLNRGDYRKSAALFKELPAKFPTSAYVNDAMYWQAFSLYRIGSTPELQEALSVLEALKTKAPETPRPKSSSNAVSTTTSNGVTVISNGMADRLAVDRVTGATSFTPYLFRSSGTDAAALAARIANVLSQRGLANDAAVKRALAAAGDACDSEDQQVRAEALAALVRSDEETGRQSAVRILAKKDECSASLRRSALSILSTKQDEATAAILIPVAKSDPSADVRNTAILYLGRMPGDAALSTLQALSTSTDNDGVQQAAIRALSTSTNPKAKSSLRALIEKNDAPEMLRLTALQNFGRESSADDVAWLRGLYPRVTSPRIKEYIASAVGRIGGDASEAWLTALVRNEDEPIEARMSALRNAGRSMDVAALGKVYDASSQRQIRSTVVDLLASRTEPAAVDKLIEIAKTGTDPGLRRSAISALARSKDPRAQKLLLDLVDHL